MMFINDSSRRRLPGKPRYRVRGARLRCNCLRGSSVFPPSAFMDRLPDFIHLLLLDALLSATKIFEPRFLPFFMSLGFSGDLLQPASRLRDRAICRMDRALLSQDGSPLNFEVAAEPLQVVLSGHDFRHGPASGPEAGFELFLPSPLLQLQLISNLDQMRHPLLLIVVAMLSCSQGTLGGIQLAAQVNQVSVERIQGLGGHVVSV
jgi:hypothetical protein